MLTNNCSTVDKDFQTLLLKCSKITTYGVQTRYPFSPDIEENDMKIALSDTNKIYTFVINKLNS